MLLYPGLHVLKVDDSGLMNLDWASVSASAPSFLKVRLNDDLIEDVFVGAYSPHTWWGNNPLIPPARLVPQSRIVIEVGPGAVLRIEGNLVEVRP